jgi:hypothetical protein
MRRHQLSFTAVSVFASSSYQRRNVVGGGVPVGILKWRIELLLSAVARNSDSEMREQKYCAPPWASVLLSNSASFPLRRCSLSWASCIDLLERQPLPGWAAGFVFGNEELDDFRQRSPRDTIEPGTK